MKEIEGLPKGSTESLIESAKFIVNNKTSSRYDAFIIGLHLGRLYHKDDESFKELQEWAKVAEN